MKKVSVDFTVIFMLVFLAVTLLTSPQDSFSNNKAEELGRLEPGTITVISPNGGEKWPRKSTQDITWDNSGLAASLKITLWQNGNLIGIIAKDVDPASGSYPWAAGKYDGGTASEGTGYTVKIKEMGTTVSDVSDASFAIVAPTRKSITITSPNGGENWDFSSTKAISWDTTGAVGDIKITLWKDEVLAGTIAGSISSAPGSFQWEAGQITTGTAPPGSGYTIKIKEKGTAISDKSDAPFSMRAWIKISAPNGGPPLEAESWPQLSEQAITWEASGLSAKMKITLWQNETLVGTIDKDVYTNSRYYKWTVGQYIGGTAPPGTGYKIKVKEKGTATADRSDGPFEITNPAPVISSTNPISAGANMTPLTLTVKGTGFISSSMIIFRGIEKETTYISPTQLSCRIDPADITAAFPSTPQSGCSAGGLRNLPVVVRNPTPGGGDSNTVNFTIGIGSGFSQPVNISNLLVRSEFPALALDGAGNIYMVWINVNSGGSGNLSFVRSTNSGSSWSAPKNISNIVVDEDEYLTLFSAPALAVDSAGNCNVAWVNYLSAANSEIYFRRKAYNSTGWSGIVNLSRNWRHSYSPDIAVDSAGNINVVWLQYTGILELHFRRSTNNGSSWSPAVDIANDDLDSSLKPGIAIDSAGGINAVWSKVMGYFTLHIGSDIFFSRSGNNGSSWAAGVNISNNWQDQYESYYPDIAVGSAGNMFIVWSDYYDILFSRSADNGANWSEDAVIFSGPVKYRRSENPRMVVDCAGNIYVVWQDYTPGNDDIYFFLSTDQGVSWSQVFNISNNSGNSQFPSIAVDNSGNIYVVWHDYTPGRSEIFFSRSMRNN